MTNDIVSVWGDGIKISRQPDNGEVLIGNGANFRLSTLTAGSGVTITNSSGNITINATGSGGTVTSVGATAPITSTGGTAPVIGITTPISAQYGGTGLATLTANNLLVGNGTGAVSFIAPGTSGNVLTSNGTGWTSAAPAVAWTTLIKSSDQSVSSSTTFVDATDLAFAMAANARYIIRGSIAVNHSGGGAKLSFNGPASPVRTNVTAYGTTFALNSFSGTYGSAFFSTSLTATQTWVIPVNFVIENGANAGNFSIQFAQNQSNGVITSLLRGSYIEYRSF